MKFLKFILGILLYLSIFSLIYTIHANFFYVSVVLYSAIFDSILASIITIIILWNRSYFKLFTRFEKLQIFIIYLLIGYSLSISIPTIIDRSVSIYLIEKIKNNGGSVKKSALKEFVKDYIIELQVIEVRLTEQLKSGNIIIENECVKLTKRGKTVSWLTYNFKKYFLPKKRLLLGEYDDDLTDIYKNSDTLEYICK